MIKEIDMITILTILLFGLPVLIHSLKLRLFNEFQFYTLTKAFNKAIIVQIVVAIVLGILAYAIDKTLYAIGQGNMLTSIIVSTAMTYNIIAAFFYIPGIILMNLINWILTKK